MTKDKRLTVHRPFLYNGRRGNNKACKNTCSRPCVEQRFKQWILGGYVLRSRFYEEWFYTKLRFLFDLRRINHYSLPLNNWWQGGMMVLHLEYKSIKPDLYFILICCLTCIDSIWFGLTEYFSEHDIPVKTVPIVGSTRGRLPQKLCLQ